jgi:hypothetical protein
MALKCKICGHVEADWLPDHLAEAHGLTVDAYLAKHPGAPTASQRLLDRWEKGRPKHRRTLPPQPADLAVDFAGVSFPVHTSVPPEACLPLPPEYRIPRHGGLGKDVQHAVVSLARKRSLYIWGLPGSGKDALFHAWSAQTRTPAVIFQVQPGVDIQGWFFSRAFDDKGTSWEEGELLKALRDGYVTPDGERVPYLVLISDFDRADRAQAEYLRLVTDSIQGRVKGPRGVTYPVLPGTIVAATANTAGAGDSRGRMVSANVIDASILDRFNRTFQFRWLDWKDEEPIVRAKFPMLVEKCPEVFPTMGRVTATLRKAIAAEELYAEFSHRALCTVLGHAEDLIFCSGGKKVPSRLLKKAARAWLDGLPDEETRQAARNLIDPHLKGGAIDEGDTSHIGDGSLAENWS